MNYLVPVSGKSFSVTAIHEMLLYLRDPHGGSLLTPEVHIGF